MYVFPHIYVCTLTHIHTYKCLTIKNISTWTKSPCKHIHSHTHDEHIHVRTYTYTRNIRIKTNYLTFDDALPLILLPPKFILTSFFIPFPFTFFLLFLVTGLIKCELLSSISYGSLNPGLGFYTGPYLDGNIVTNITTQTGTHAYLPCKVKNILIIWIMFEKLNLKAFSYPFPFLGRFRRIISNSKSQIPYRITPVFLV